MWKENVVEVKYGRGGCLKEKMEKMEGATPHGNANNAKALARLLVCNLESLAYMSSPFGRFIAHLLSIVVLYC